MTQEPRKTMSNILVTINKRITFIIFYIMLFWHVLGSFHGGWMGDQKILFYWIGVSYLFVGYILCSITIWLNKDNLQCLKIDGNFMLIFILTGALISFSLPFLVGILVGLVTLFNYGIFQSGKTKFGKFHQKRWQVIMLIAVSLIQPISGVWWSGKAITFPGSMDIFITLIKTNIPQVVIEEIVFRGMLWMFLSNLNLKDGSIVFIQALLFWLVHHSYLPSRPITFWIYLPILSIVYGIIVWRTKSITPSFVAHLLNNMIAVLAQ